MTHYQTTSPMRRIEPIHQITPFTYRDGSTYLEILNKLREYVTHVAVPEVHYELNRIIGEFQKAISEVERSREGDLSEWETRFNDFIITVDGTVRGPRGLPGIGSQGILSDPVNMDNMRDTSHMGTYSARMDNLINGPDIDTGQPVTVEIIRDSVNSVTQRISSSTEVWWRNARGNDDFNPWRQVARFDQIPAFTHGIIDSPVDLDAMRDTDQSGSYSVRADHIINGPEFSDDNPVATLEIYRNSSNGILQRLTTRTQSFWRHAASSTTWDEWTQSAVPDVISSNRYAELQDGQTLYVIDERNRSYDFAGSFPDGMNRSPVDAGGVWGRNDDDSLLGGRGIRHLGGAPSVVVWDDTEGFDDGDILVRLQRSDMGTISANALTARHSDNGSGPNSYICYVTTLSGEVSLAVARRVDGSTRVLQQVPVNIGENQVFYMRFNLQETMLSAKAWLENDVEPHGWMLSTTDTTHSQGKVGFQGSSVTVAWDVLSVNQSGGLAQ